MSNPSNGEINVNSKFVNYYLEIFDITGKLKENLFISKGNKSYQLNLDNGIYLYKLTSNEFANNINGKLIISKN